MFDYNDTGVFALDGALPESAAALPDTGEETPALRRMIEEAVRSASAGSEIPAPQAGREVNVVLELDGERLARTVYRMNDEESRRVGARLGQEGGY